MNMRRLLSLFVLLAVAALPATLAAQGDAAPKPPVIPPRTVVVDPYEPNDDPGMATWMDINGLRNALVDPAGDVDFYAFYAWGAQTITAEIDASEVGSALDPTLTLYAGDGVTELAFDDNSDPDLDPRITYDLPGEGTYYLKVAGAGGSQGYYWLFLTGGDAYEPNNKVSQAKRIQLGNGVHAIVDPEGDRDWFKFRLEAGQTVALDIDASVMGSAIDSYLELYDRDGKTVLAANDDNFSLDSYVRYTVTQAGQYYVRVTDLFDRGGPEYFYTLKVTLFDLWYLSPGKAGRLGGLSFAANDIISYDAITGAWAMVFDASDVGVKANITAFDVTDACLLMAFGKAQTLPLGKAAPQDVVRFCPDWDATGEDTHGSFDMFFDGSDVGLTTAGEAIDALAYDGDSQSLLLSFDGAANVTNDGGDAVAAQDEDVVYFLSYGFGGETDGEWSLFLDGSTLDGLAAEDVGGLGYDPANGMLWLSLKNAFTIEGVSGDGNDIIALRPDWSTGNFQWLVEPAWDGSAAGFTLGIDGLTRP